MQNWFDLTGKRIVVTGAAGGIGSAIVSVCAGLGAEVIGVDILDRHDVNSGGSVEYRLCDVTDRGAVELLCSKIGSIDAAVLGAGILPQEPLEDAEWDRSFDGVMAVNVKGIVNFARALMPRMKAAGGGSMAIIGSISAYTGGQLSTTPPQYAMSKGAVHTLIRCLARQGAGSVRVNGVAPGVINTAFVKTPYTPPPGKPMPRIGEPEDVAWPVAFLCSRASQFMTGAIVQVNGGAYMA